MAQQKNLTKRTSKKGSIILIKSIEPDNDLSGSTTLINQNKQYYFHLKQR